MAHILRLRLHALCSSRLLPSSASACKLLTSPDLRRTSLRWYGEGALLEDHCNSNNEIDGGSMASNQEGIMVKESEGIKGQILQSAHAAPSINSFNLEDPLESSLGKLTSLMSDQSEAKLNIAHDEKGSTEQSQAERLSTDGSSKSAKDDKSDKWQQLFSNMRTMALKKKAKAGDAENSGSTKTDQLEGLNLEALPARGQQSSVSEGLSVSNREPLNTPVFGKNLKQKHTQSQTSSQQKNTQSQNLNQQKNIQSQSSNQQKNTQSQSSNQQKNTQSQNLNQQKNIQSQSSNQQKSKNLKPLSFDFLKMNETSKELENGLNYKQDSRSKSDPKELSDDEFIDETTPDDLRNWSSAMNSVDELFSNLVGKPKSLTSLSISGVKSKDGGSQYKNPQSSKDALPNSRGKDSSYSRVPQGNDGHGQDRNQQPKGRIDASNTAKGRNPSGTWETIHQPSSNGDAASRKVNMVCVQNLPPTCNPGSVKASMFMHGEVTGFFKKPVSSDKLTVYVQFKTAEAMENALASRKLQIGNRTCFITRADHPVFTSVVRITKVSPDTDESQLRAVCEKYGKVDSVKKRMHGVFDVFYDMKELGNIASIITSLNEVNLNRHTWYALPAPALHPSVQMDVLKSAEGQSWHDFQVNLALNRIESGLDTVWVLFDDLKELSLAARGYSK